MKNLSMSKKLAVLIAAFMTTLVIVAAMSHTMIGRMADTGEGIYEERLIPIRALGQLRTDNRALEGYLLELMLTTDGSRNEELQANIEERRNGMIQNLKTFNDTYTSRDASINQEIEDLSAEIETYLAGVDPVMRPALRNENIAAYR